MERASWPVVNRITELLGIEIPIIQAPMGWIARAPLASAVSNAGGLGVIETSSGEPRRNSRRNQDDAPTDRQAVRSQHRSGILRDPGIVSFVIDQGVTFRDDVGGRSQQILWDS